MGWAGIWFLAIGLAMDAAAVSLGVAAGGGAAGVRPIFRLRFHFALFQGLMTFLGWLVGTGFAYLISGVDHWVATGLLAIIGARMIRAGMSQEAQPKLGDPSRGMPLVALSVATSIDALAAGISLAMLAVVIVALVTGVLSVAGLLVGSKLGQTFGRRMEIFGGVILLAVGLRLLVSHLG
ncbi:MAG: manganese efflux pump MntP family protein [Actinobacteria bacterium]|nr:manganese efflux pump MntP family protein [Actinomycetota bacterium]